MPTAKADGPWLFVPTAKAIDAVWGYVLTARAGGEGAVGTTTGNQIRCKRRIPHQTSHHPPNPNPQTQTTHQIPPKPTNQLHQPKNKPQKLVFKNVVFGEKVKEKEKNKEVGSYSLAVDVDNIDV